MQQMKWIFRIYLSEQQMFFHDHPAVIVIITVSAFRCASKTISNLKLLQSSEKAVLQTLLYPFLHSFNLYAVTHFEIFPALRCLAEKEE